MNRYFRKPTLRDVYAHIFLFSTYYLLVNLVYNLLSMVLDGDWVYMRIHNLVYTVATAAVSFFVVRFLRQNYISELKNWFTLYAVLVIALRLSLGLSSFSLVQFFV